MNFRYTNLETCQTATGLVVVIDVIRAFTNAAFAFSRGAKEIYPVRTVEEALKFKAEVPNSMAFGRLAASHRKDSILATHLLKQIGWIFMNVFWSNVPAQAHRASCEASMRTRCWLPALWLQTQPSRHIRHLHPDSVTFVITGQLDDERGDEDLACAEYFEALLRGQKIDPAPYIERVYKSRDALFHLDPNLPQFPASDLDYCTKIDAFDFAMSVTKENGRPVMRAIKP